MLMLGVTRKTSGPVANLDMSIDGTPGGTQTIVEGITFGTDGTIKETGFIGGWYVGPSNYYLPTTVSIGNSYWVKFTLSSGVAWTAGLVSGTIYALSTARAITWSTPALQSKTASVAIVVYSDSGGTTVVGSGTFSFLIDNT